MLRRRQGTRKSVNSLVASETPRAVIDNTGYVVSSVWRSMGIRYPIVFPGTTDLSPISYEHFPHSLPPHTFPPPPSPPPHFLLRSLSADLLLARSHSPAVPALLHALISLSFIASVPPQQYHMLTNGLDFL